MYEFVLDYSGQYHGIMMNNIEIFQFTFSHLQAELILPGTIYISMYALFYILFLTSNISVL